MKIEGINLKEFIGRLVSIYNEGADFIDLELDKKGEDYYINIEVLPEYMADEEKGLDGDMLNKLLNNT